MPTRSRSRFASRSSCRPGSSSSKARAASACGARTSPCRTSTAFSARGRRGLPGQLLLRVLVEVPGQPIEHGGGRAQLRVAELGKRGAPFRLDPGAVLLDDQAPAARERGEDDALVLLGAQAINE